MDVLFFLMGFLGLLNSGTFQIMNYDRRQVTELT